MTPIIAAAAMTRSVIPTIGLNLSRAIAMTIRPSEKPRTPATNHTPIWIIRPRKGITDPSVGMMLRSDLNQPIMRRIPMILIAHVFIILFDSALEIIVSASIFPLVIIKILSPAFAV